MNAKLDFPCRYFLQGICREGDQCRYSHDTTSIQKINLERNSDGKLQINNQNEQEKLKRPAYRGKQNTNNKYDRPQYDQQSEEFEDNKERKRNYDQGYKLNITKQNDNYQSNKQVGQQQINNYNDDNRRTFNNFRGSQQNMNNNVNSDRWERFQENDEQKSYQFKGLQNNQRGRGRGRGNSRFSTQQRDQKYFNKGFDQNEQQGIQEFNGNQEDNINIDYMQNKQKRVKKNDTVVQQRAKLFKLEQYTEISEFVKFLGFYQQKLIILRSNQVEFYDSSYKINGTDLLDENLKTNLDHIDKIFVNGWVQEKQDGNLILIIEFLRKGEKIKNLLIFPNLYLQQQQQQQQSIFIINEVSLKNIVFAEKEQDIIITFCQDGLIRIFQLCVDQYKYVQHFNIEQTIETVIKVGSNYLISTRQNKILLYDGQKLERIQYQFDKICTQMIIDVNRVILKLDNENESSIYILSQNLQVTGPIYNGGKFNSFAVIKNYENDKLFILSVNNQLETLKEVDNKLYLFNKLQNQSVQNIQKFEVTNENMLIQKYIIGNNGLHIKIFSIIPEE